MKHSLSLGHLYIVPQILSILSYFIYYVHETVIGSTEASHVLRDILYKSVLSPRWKEARL